MKLRLNFQMKVFISHLILSENLLNDTKNYTAKKKMKKSHIGNMPQGYSQFYGFGFFQSLTYLKKDYIMMIPKFLMGYHNCCTV